MTVEAPLAAEAPVTVVEAPLTAVVAVQAPLTAAVAPVPAVDAQGSEAWLGQAPPSAQ